MARNYAVARLVADVSLRINEARMLDLDDVRKSAGHSGELAELGRGLGGETVMLGGELATATDAQLPRSASRWLANHGWTQYAGGWCCREHADITR